MTSHARQSGTDPVTLDDLFDALKQAPRRRILVALLEQNPRHETEFVESDGQSAKRPRDTARVELHHRHLPHLRDLGYVDWDRETDTITKGPRFEEIRPFLTLMQDHREELPYDWP